MFNKVLVPLDGSRLAEAVLPYVEELARKAGLEQVALLRVVQAARELGTADSYLERTANRLVSNFSPFPHGVQWVSTQAQAGDAAPAILRFAEDNEADLILLTTHGQSGIDRWLMGSTAEKVLRGTDIPVFLVPATEGGRRVGPPQLRRVMVPLDGSAAAEQALEYVAQLAGRSAALEVTLLHVAPVAATNSSVGPRSGLDSGPPHWEGMPSYLASVAGRLAAAGMQVTTSVRAGHPGEQAIAAATEASVDLIVMCSHGHAGLAEGAFGSVADYVLRSSPTPILLVPVSLKEAAPPHQQGPLVYACHHCGRRVYWEAVTSADRCSRCHAHLKSCPNCIFFSEERGCLYGSPLAEEADPGNRCQRFEFRKTRLPLR